ncbi:MAG: Lrp/AsnC family transcriptional regulator [Planctomycetes bacterium]|nr:Lrp/AsnC family transcriptional regulator [Planctomycetota bacterium]NOG52947.1 Lrp/AsnC family transcriptional regulator [Planctomycetota bacterium]
MARSRKKKQTNPTSNGNGMSHDFHPDETDQAILQYLQHNGRMTNAELASRVGLSPPSTLERVRKLEDRGIIRGYVALLDPVSVNRGTVVLVSLTLREHGHQPLEAVKEALNSLDEVLSVWHTAGDDDFVAKIAVPDLAAYEQFVSRRLSAIPHISRIRSTIVLSTCKDSTELTLDGPSD